MNMKKTVWIAVALVMVVALVAALPALSQPGGPPGGEGMGGPGMGGPGMGRPMGGPPAATMVVNDKGVYILMGPQILRLDPETLKVLAKAELPRPEPPTKPEGGNK
jgi:hypothetical protein